MKGTLEVFLRLQGFRCVEVVQIEEPAEKDGIGLQHSGDFDLAGPVVRRYQDQNDEPLTARKHSKASDFLAPQGAAAKRLDHLNPVCRQGDSTSQAVEQSV